MKKITGRSVLSVKTDCYDNTLQVFVETAKGNLYIRIYIDDNAKFSEKEIVKNTVQKACNKLNIVNKKIMFKIEKSAEKSIISFFSLHRMSS